MPTGLKQIGALSLRPNSSMLVSRAVVSTSIRGMMRYRKNATISCALMDHSYRRTLAVGAVGPPKSSVTARIQPSALAQRLLCFLLEIFWVGGEVWVRAMLRQQELFFLVQRPVGVALSGRLDSRIHDQMKCEYWGSEEQDASTLLYSYTAQGEDDGQQGVLMTLKSRK